ncbi:ECF transporter S component [Myceligenerans pegani]|uniref:ECF transporter S component n=1 Tax=Myceligenerans pegani TaxID=2776917 RepID=A0ABR9N3Q1_9MICO|nr:ECF transporter S component [Myceligenerans sp. TRM 65318]MBE1878279.1 ECF transporter S component [Myceligenerans sp. TRM 65318]MBE3020550.1 ECF transporter S component [Myceligenerans sp. TRM 65318]
MTLTSRYSTRLLLSTAAIGAAGGLLVVGLNYALVGLPPSSVTYAIYAATTPAWSLGAFVAMALFRRPGIALLTSVFSGLVNLASPFGVAQLVNFLVIGLLLELPFAVALYRRWSDRFLWVAFPVGALLLSAGYLAPTLAAGAIVPSDVPLWLAALLVVATLALALGLTALSLRTATSLRKAGIAVGPTPSPTTAE